MIPAPPWVQRAAGIRAVDAALIAEVGIPSAVLMEQAGAGVARAVRAWAEARGLGTHTAGPRTVVLCGPGNNGGDGYVVARHLAQAGWAVSVVDVLAGGAARTPECALFAGVCERLGVAAGWLADPALVVDAVFGTGQRPGSGDPGWWGAGDVPVIALDVPTGVDADTGAILGAPPSRVDHVVTIGRAKPFLFMGAWLPRWTGSWELVDIGFGTLGAPDATLWTASARRDLPVHANKWDRGHVAVVAGARGTSGAAILTCRAALRSGAGLVTLFPGEGCPLDGLPAEVMVSDRSAPETDDARFACVVVGPGLGRARDADVRRLWAGATPLVLDADGLRVEGLAEPGGLRLLTPHAAEAGAWLGQDWRWVEADRLRAAGALRAPKVAAILKGACPVVTGGPPTIHEGRCPTLGTAGSGDVLAGICGALLALAKPATLSAVEGIASLAVAAHLAAGRGLAAGAFASDVADALPGVFSGGLGT